MTIDEALAFIAHHGVVLVSARGSVPRLTEAIVGAPITGSWWAHPHSHRIFALLQAVNADPDVLVCRLVDGKITLLHRRLWPALVRVAARFPADRLAWVREEHTPAGHHVSHEVAFPDWVPADVMEAATGINEAAALAALGRWATASGPTSKPPRRQRRAAAPDHDSPVS